MLRKKYFSLLKWATSAAAVCSITAISALATSCVANNNNNSNNSQQSSITIEKESPESQNVDSDTSLNLFVEAVSNVGDLTYQWYVDKNDGNSFIAISGATSDNYEISEKELSTVTIKTTWKYKVEIASVKNPKENITKEYSVNITPHTPTDQNYNTNEVPSALKFDYDKVNISDLSSAADLDFYYKDKITKRYDRTANVGYYQTDLEKQYGDSNFKYPSYNYNYEEGRNRFLKLSNGQEVNMMTLVYNERTTNNAGEQVKYNNADWIKEQISAGKLKAHPAAKTWYEQNVTQETQAVDKQFTIGATKTGLYSLGLYAPAGEVITLKFDDATFNLIKESKYTGLKVIINDNYWDNYPQGNSGEISNRYPFVSTTFNMDSSNNTIQFGSPFGGNISISLSYLLQDTTDSLNSKIEPISFTVSGAVESLDYVHGYTTESDWNRQVQDVIDGKITAPSMSAMYSWSSMNIPFTASKTVAGIKAENIVYPYEAFKKWNNFQFLSVYTARSYSKMLSMKFCDDIWGSAGAWGGGHNIYVPISWAGASFLSGVENFNIKSSWGLMHEMNHNYQQDNTLFRKMYHNKTNQMSMVSFSILSDMGRHRSESNILQEGTSLKSPGWTYLSNSYGNIEKITKTTGNGEYPTYGALLFNIGARNYIEYTRWAAVNHPNTMKGWTGLKEIQALSNYFQVDFWPAFQSTYHIWHDEWPASYDTATSDEKAIIDSLKQYSAVEFVGNLYAAGIYLYNKETGQYRYTGDVNAPYEISGYQDYTFDFGNYINSSNTNFNWSNLQVDSTSKNGVPLKVEGKKVVYSASQAKYNDDIDEFDVTITPGTWDGKPSNYVPAYKWKIKVRNAIQEPKINLYTGVTNWDINSSNHADEVKKYIAAKTMSTRDFSNQNAYILENKNQNLLRASFSFIAPSDGTYVFNALWNKSIVIYENNSKITNANFNSPSSTKTKVYEKSMKANEIITFDIFVYNDSSSCSFDFGVTSNNQDVDLSTSLLGFGAAKAAQTLGSSYTFNIYNTDQRFQYKPRFENYLSYIQNTNSSTSISNSNFVIPSKDLYTLKGIESSSKVDVSPLYNIGGPSVEIWDSNKLSFEVDFKTPTQVGSLRFGHRTDNHQNYRPTQIKVIGIDANNNSTVLYSGDYSTKISSRSSNSTIVNLNSISTVKSLKIELTNTLVDKGMVMNWFSYSPDIYMPLNNNVAVDNNYIAKTDGWNFIKNNDNDYGIISSYGSSSLLTTTKYSAIDFNLKNSNGFRIIGSTTTSQSVFDVYINDKIYKRNVKVGGANVSNVEMFKYVLPEVANDLRVTIVNKSTNPLIINFIQTYGYNGPVYTSPVIVKK